uniref:Uncharacterized protein n=1 Tax=Oryza rufipogon TaxID=4529 RepID=A0A0E0PHG4_ORYRU
MISWPPCMNRATSVGRISHPSRHYDDVSNTNEYGYNMNLIEVDMMRVAQEHRCLIAEPILLVYFKEVMAQGFVFLCYQSRFVNGQFCTASCVNPLIHSLQLLSSCKRFSGDSFEGASPPGL